MMVIQSVDGLAETEWDVPHVCGDWSVKEILAHLTSYEHVVVDILSTFLGNEPTSYVFGFLKEPAEFNNTEVEARRYSTAQQVLDEYNDTQVESESLLEQIPDEKVSQKGTMPGYGEEYSLTDFINVMYEHTREHCQQIARFRERVR